MSPSKIYVASSWRNAYQPSIVGLLRYLGHEVYDFRKPPNGPKGFSWAEIDPKWQQWTSQEYWHALYHPKAREGFENDFTGMKWADTCLLVLPAGRSAHSEAGWMKGNGKRTIVYMPEMCEPELMYKLYDHILISEQELRRFFFCTD